MLCLILCFRLNLTFEGYAPWTIDLTSYSLEDFVEVTEREGKMDGGREGEGGREKETCVLTYYICTYTYT